MTTKEVGLIDYSKPLKLVHAVLFLQTLLNIWAVYIYFILHLHTTHAFDFCYFIIKWS